MIFLSKSKRIIITIAVLLLICVIFSAVIFYQKHQSELSKQLADTNGDSKELCTITDEMIEDCLFDYNIIGRQLLTKGDQTSGVNDGATEEFDKDYVRLKTKMLTGVIVVNSYFGDGESLCYRVVSEVKGGNMKIVLTDEDNKILQSIPIDKEYTLTYPTEADKTYYLKAVGECAETTISVYRNEK